MQKFELLGVTLDGVRIEREWTRFLDAWRLGVYVADGGDAVIIRSCAPSWLRELLFHRRLREAREMRRGRR